MRRYFVTADTVKSDKVIDYFNYSKGKQVLAGEDNVQLRGLPVNTSWLREASKTYNISDDLKDYVIVPVKIFFSDLPNRNGVAFPKSELLKFNPEYGCIGAKTWVGKPTFLEHNNSILSNAKGVIFDTTIKPSVGMKGGLVDVINLCGFDRTKDPQLVNQILSGKLHCYSMGAYSDDFQCSVCGKLISKGGCEHCSLTNPKFEVFNGKLGFANVINPVGFETSCVETPAFLSATTDGHHFVAEPR